MVAPEQGVDSVLVALLQEGNILPCLSINVWTHTGHSQGQLSRGLKVSLKEFVEYYHVGFLAEQHVIG